MDEGRSSTRSSMDKTPVDHVESARPDEGVLQRFELLRGKSDEDLKQLDRKVLKKLDWRFLPCITAMLLMKYGCLDDNPQIAVTDIAQTAIWTASMSPMLDSPACKRTWAT